jgi:hypothetical protein
LWRIVGRVLWQKRHLGHIFYFSMGVVHEPRQKLQSKGAWTTTM